MESAIRSAFVGIGVNGIQGSVMRALGINERMDILVMILYCIVMKLLELQIGF